jgi:hypothetical protein
MSTNLEDVFQKITTIESMRKTTDGPKKPLVLVIFSDMEFDAMVKSNNDTYDGNESISEELLKTETLQLICKDAGIAEVPIICYWDIAGRNSQKFPASADTSKVILLSGMSDGPLNALLTANFDAVTPEAFMHAALAKLPFHFDFEMVVD